MPFYKYQCKNCHVSVTAIHGMNEKYKEICKYCGAVDWQQIIYPPAIHFKGTGFFQTDYKNKEKVK